MGLFAKQLGDQDLDNVSLMAPLQPLDGNIKVHQIHCHQKVKFHQKTSFYHKTVSPQNRFIKIKLRVGTERNTNVMAKTTQSVFL